MRHQHQRRATRPFELEHQIDDALTRRFIEIAGRLIGDQNGRVRRERAGERHALLLAARQLRRIMRQSLAQPDLLQLRPGAVESVRRAGEFERNGDVFQRRHGRNEMKRLEDDADVLAAKPGQFVLAQPIDARPRDADFAAVGPFQSGHGHQQCRFSRSGRSDETDRLALAYIEANALQDMNPRRAAPEAEMHIVEFDRPVVHDPSVVGAPSRAPGRKAGSSATTYGRSARILQVLLAFLGLAALLASPAAAKTTRLLALGDSLTAGYLLSADAGFPAVLEKALRAKGHDVEVINAGVSGDTATGALERLDWAIGEGVDAAVVEIGANDMLRGLDPRITAGAIDSILTKLKERKAAVLLAGMLATPSLGAEYKTAFDRIYPDLAARHGVALYPFFLDGVAGEKDMQQGDGMHPTRAGVARIIERILPAVEAMLKNVERRN